MSQKLLATLVLITCIAVFKWHSSMAQEEGEAAPIPAASEETTSEASGEEVGITTDEVEEKALTVADDLGPFVSDPNQPGLLRGEAMVMMADKTYKQVSELKVGDELMHVLGIPLPESLSLSPAVKKLVDEARERMNVEEKTPTNKIVSIEKVMVGKHPTTTMMEINSDTPVYSTATIVYTGEGWAAVDPELAEKSLFGKTVGKIKKLEFGDMSIWNPLETNFKGLTHLEEAEDDKSAHVMYRLVLDYDGIMIVQAIDNLAALMPINKPRTDLPEPTGRGYNSSVLKGIATMLICKPRVANRSMLVLYVDKINDRAMFADYIRVKGVSGQLSDSDKSNSSMGLRFNLDSGEFIERIGRMPPTDCERKNLKEMK